jgi:hypothetical protein
MIGISEWRKYRTGIPIQVNNPLCPAIQKLLGISLQHLQLNAIHSSTDRVATIMNTMPLCLRAENKRKKEIQSM